MIRNILGAVAILALSLGITMADEIKGKISKIDGNKITVTSKNDAAGKQLEVAPGVKVNKMAKGGAKEDVAGGLASVKEGSNATITTGGDGKVTEITIVGGKKKAN